MVEDEKSWLNIGGVTRLEMKQGGWNGVLMVVGDEGYCVECVGVGSRVRSQKVRLTVDDGR